MHFKYLGLAGVMTEFVNVRKYRALLESLPECDRVNISYNIVLPSPIVDVVFFKIENVKMTYSQCNQVLRFKHDS